MGARVSRNPAPGVKRESPTPSLPAPGALPTPSVSEVITGALLEGSLDFEETLSHLAHALVPDLADWCSVEMAEPDGSLRKVGMAHVDDRLERLGSDRMRGAVRPATERGVVPTVVRTGRPHVVSDVDEELIRATASSPEHARLLLELGLCSLMVVPLRARGRIIGALSFAMAGSGRRFGDEDLATAIDVADRAALIVDNARLYTNLKRTQEDLRHSRDELEVILSGIADGILVQDREGRLVYANDAGARALGYRDAAQLVARGSLTVAEGVRLTDEEGEPVALAQLPGARALRGEEVPERVFCCHTAEGGERWSIAKARPVLDRDGAVKLSIDIFTDITRLKHVERDRAGLLARVGTDPLTGLLNHRVFHERLAAEVARARRHGHDLALALVDVDNFKQVNDNLGHQVGDRVLARVADRLRDVARSEDVLARIGGDEFAVLLPHSDEVQAFAAIERVRRAVSAAPLVEQVRITLSAGICDLATAHDADSMFRFADGALYWSKAHGRDVAWIYDPGVIRQLSAQERAEHLQQSQTLIGIRALARAIDAKDPHTRRHSERVAAIAARLAGVLGWGFDRVALLSEAALVHDVGKLGVPDVILLKPGRLTAVEYEQLRMHPVLSGQIVEDVLRPEQVAWIRAHHERPDGFGYPDGLRGEEIPAGATLLSLADAWDVMTVSRPYATRKTHEEAMEECRTLVGRQFTGEAVAALEALNDRGLLVSADAGLTGTG